MKAWRRGNDSGVTEFIIVGFPSLPEMQILLFVVFLTIYILTMVSNAMIILLVKLHHQLHTPMYFFLSNYSFLEMSYVSTSIPKLLKNFLTGNNKISFSGCVVQLYLFSTLGTTDTFLLVLMAYDRYVAICKPLHYAMIMNPKSCILLAAASWAIGFLVASVPIILVTRLRFCGPNEIDHILCEAAPMMKLSCSDVSSVEMVFSFIAPTSILGTLLLIVVSYAFIISTIMRIPSAVGRKKALSTCSSHIIVVSIFYTTICVMYVRRLGTGSSPYRDKFVSLMYGIIIPFLNPFIYSVRNKDVKEAVRKVFQRSKAFPIIVNEHNAISQVLK
ncbi:olfactory receptor 6N1-like [Rhinatrema bivittatum]|uniref:olfactory receptor 6N1-like n=1 Tax=Rhinatrema bivittatum TaxID=194408 RepID=UPI00112761FD|nr:olfactory receptor 6N1-like [Rhinatrema bivittatum]